MIPLLFAASLIGVSTSLTVDFYMLSQEWPQSICQLHKDETTHGCDIPANVTSWTIHGLWPSVYSGKYPAGCPGPPFNMTQLKPLLPAMLQLWPNIYHEKTSESFWQHEYDKHGKCALESGAVATQVEYFTQTLTLSIRDNIIQILMRAGIFPQKDPMPKDTLVSALDNALNKRFILVCEKDPKLDEYMIKEMRICYSDQWQLVDCYDDDDQSTYHEQMCNTDTLLYPPIEHTTLLPKLVGA